MRFIVMVKGDKDYEAGAPPNPQLMAAIGQNAEELIKAGVMVSTEGLQPSSRGAKVIHEDILGPSWSGECKIRELWDVFSSGTVECQGLAEELAEK